MNLSKCFDAYKRHVEHKESNRSKEVRFFQSQENLECAIIVSAGCRTYGGKKHPHQYRIPENTLRKATNALLNKKDDLVKTANFEALYDRVSAIIRPIPKIGELTAYDVAFRLSLYLDRRPEEFVYLHAGARDGAKALARLGLTELNFRQTKIERRFFEAIGKGFEDLFSDQIEDFLCHHKSCFGKLGCGAYKNMGSTSCKNAGRAGRRC